MCGFSTTENAYEQKKTIDFFFCEMVLSAEGEGRRPRKTEKDREGKRRNETEKKRRS